MGLLIKKSKHRRLKAAPVWSRKISAIIAVALIIAVSSSGCASILEGDTGVIVTRHTSAVETFQPGNAPEASDYGELKAALLALVMQRAESGQIVVNSYEGDIYGDIKKACEEIKTHEPIGAFALSDITAEATQIVSYLEIDAELTYKRTWKQMDSIITVPTMQYLRAELLGFMVDYTGEAVISTAARGITAEEIEKAVRELYYANPLSVVMLPGVGVEQFPADAEEGERLFELSFNFNITTSLLVSYNRQLRESVILIAGTVDTEDNDSEGLKLLDLARKLAESCVYNEARAAMIAEHGVQNFDATAYGALLSASAVGEGYAMAFKALCDELDIPCYVVLGTLGGAAHAWNIVALEGDYYHVDVAMCSKNGMETAFLLRDGDMPDTYEWDRRSVRACNGELTYFDFAEPEPEPEAEETDAGAEAETDTEALET